MAEHATAINAVNAAKYDFEAQQKNWQKELRFEAEIATELSGSNFIKNWNPILRKNIGAQQNKIDDYLQNMNISRLNLKEAKIRSSLYDKLPYTEDPIL